MSILEAGRTYSEHGLVWKQPCLLVPLESDSFDLPFAKIENTDLTRLMEAASRCNLMYAMTVNIQKKKCGWTVKEKLFGATKSPAH